MHLISRKKDPMIILALAWALMAAVSLSNPHFNSADVVFIVLTPALATTLITPRGTVS